MARCFPGCILLSTPLLGLSGTILASAAHPPPHLKVLLGHFTAFLFVVGISIAFQHLLLVTQLKIIESSG